MTASTESILLCIPLLKSQSTLMQGKDFHISAANLWLWSVVVFMLMLVTFGIGAATGGPSILQLPIMPWEKI